MAALIIIACALTFLAVAGFVFALCLFLGGIVDKMNAAITALSTAADALIAAKGSSVPQAQVDAAADQITAIAARMQTAAAS